MKKFTVSLLFSLALLSAAPLAFGQVNGAVLGNNTGNNTTYRDVKLVGNFPLFVYGSNQFVISNITSYATQSNLQNSAVEVPSRSILSVGTRLVSSVGGTNIVQWGLAGSIDGNFWNTNVYTGSNTYNGTTPFGQFSDVATNIIYRYLALCMLSAPNTTNITGSIYYQFRPGP